MNSLNDANEKETGKENFSNLNISDMEQRFVLKALEKADNSITDASKLLGISRQALYRYIEKYKINI
jgi:transcriptional regulator with PAS, ATPase and Fis domain